MSTWFRTASSALAVSLLLTTGVASAGKPAAMTAARSTSARSATKAKRATQAKLEVASAATEAAVAAAAETSTSEPTRGYRMFRAIGTAVRTILHPIRSTKSALARASEKRAARRDFEVWMNREGHEDYKTYRAGTTAGFSVRNAWRANKLIGSFGVGANLALSFTTLNPLPMVFTAMDGAIAMFSANREAKAQSAANTKTIEYALQDASRFIAKSRMQRWAKAGVIDAKYAE